MNVEKLLNEMELDSIPESEVGRFILPHMSLRETLERFDELRSLGISAETIARYTPHYDARLLLQLIDAGAELKSLTRIYCGIKSISTVCLIDLLIGAGYSPVEVVDWLAGLKKIDLGSFVALLRKTEIQPSELLEYVKKETVKELFDDFLSVGVDINHLLRRIGYMPYWYMAQNIQALLEKGAQPGVVLDGIVGCDQALFAGRSNLVPVINGVAYYRPTSGEMLFEAICRNDKAVLASVISNLCSDEKTALMLFMTAYISHSSTSDTDG